jgi:hypothetical protein
VHPFRAVDDREEIVTPQTIAMDGFVQTTRDNVLWPTLVEMSDFAAPVQ